MRLLPVAMAGAVLLGLVKAERLASALWQGTPQIVPAAQASSPPPAPAPRPASAPAPPPPPPAPPPEAAAERAVLEALRARRAEIDRREQASAQREVMLAAAERRLTQRIEELGALQSRLEALERERAAREEQGLRGLVKLYEGMRPRDAAAIFDELEMPVLLPILNLMKEAKAAPVLAAMKLDRARAATAELSRLRAERVDARP